MLSLKNRLYLDNQGYSVFHDDTPSKFLVQYPRHSEDRQAMRDVKEVLCWVETVSIARDMEVTEVTESRVSVTCRLDVDSTDTRRVVEEIMSLCYGL